MFLSHSFLPSFPEIREVHSSKICLFFIINNKLKHIQHIKQHIKHEATLSIMDNSHSMQLELRCYSPKWLWDTDHINLSMNFGNDKIKSHLSETVYQYAVTANVRKYHSLYIQQKKALSHPAVKAFINIRINRKKTPTKQKQIPHIT